LNRRKRRILRRIENKPGVERHRPMMAASDIRYEIAERVRAIAPGGIGAMHLLARKLGLVEVDFPTNCERGVKGYPARSYSTGDR